MKYQKSSAKIRIVPIFIIAAVILAITISSESNKQISINLEFSNSTNYDFNNDGIETINGIVDLSVENSYFTWDVDKSKLFTKWTVTNEDEGTSANLCFGSPAGCSFIDLPSASASWDDTFYVNYGKDSAGYINRVSSQIIYYDVDLSVPYSEIYYSEKAEKEVKFYEKDPEALSDMSVTIKDNEGNRIGNYQIKENNADYDLVISEKNNPRMLLALNKKVSVSSGSEAEIKGIKNVEDIEAVIDSPEDDKLTTDLIAVNASDLEFNNAEITLEKHGDVNVIMRCEHFDFENSVCNNWEKTDIQFVDEGNVIRFNVTGFSAYAGSNITIINVHSYPELYGNWTVMFTTQGTADLKIRAINGTTWTNSLDVGSGYDLRFLGLICGDNFIPYEWINNEVVVRNYSCDDTSYETQKEMTRGKHYLEFEFGDDYENAYNTVGGISLSANRVDVGSTITANVYTGTCNSWYSNNTNVCRVTFNSCTATITGVGGGFCTVNVTDGMGNWSVSDVINVTANNAPYMMNTTITLLDGTNAGLKYVSTTDDLFCVGWAHDNDYEAVTMRYNITIMETYNQGSTTYINGVTNNCRYFEQNESNYQNRYNASRGDTYCSIPINASLTSKGDKVWCTLTPYDGKVYGTSNTSLTTYINNTRPFASAVYITPANPSKSSELTCNYSFNDIDSDSENISQALFKWYINNEGLNDYIELPGQTSRTLSNSSFDKDDQIICSVMVKDIDNGWLQQPLSDDGYVNGSSVVITDNAKPQIIRFSDNSNITNPTADGNNVIFNVEWADYEDPGENAKMYVCNSLLPSETPVIENGTGNLTFGGNKTYMVYYTNLTGQYVETVALKPSGMSNISGNNIITSNTSGNFIYDVYAFEVDNVGQNIPNFNIYNASTYPIAESHNNAFTVGKYNYIKLEYNSQPLPNKRLAILFCIDDVDTDNDYCKDGMSASSETIFIRATETGVNYNINISTNKSYKDADIQINYKSSSNGTLSSTGCVGTEYCHTEFSTNTEISCSYTTTSLDPERYNNYYVKVCDDGGECSVWRQDDFWVNYKPEMISVNLTDGVSNNFTDDSNLYCSFTNKTDSWVNTTEGNLTYAFRWFYDRGNTGAFIYYSTAPTANILSNANTQTGDKWICEVTPNDGFINGLPKNSSAAYIGISSINNFIANGTPYIINITSNSNNATPTAENSIINITINWSDSNSTSLSNIFICNSSAITATGCLGYEFARSGATSSNPISIGFTADPRWSENQTAHVFIYDDTWIRSDEYDVSFVVNHRPNATGVTVDYITSSSLTCTYTFSDSKDSLDSENSTIAKFKWWMDGAEQEELKTKNISGVLIPTHTWMCAVKVYDNHNLSSADYLNSSLFYGTNSIIAPFVWAIPEAVGSDNKTENNASTINVIGYINRSNVNLTAVAKQNDEIRINSVMNGSANATILGTGFSYASYPKGTSYIRVNENYATIFTAGRFIEFTNHNKTYFTRYSITSQTYLYDGTYRININPALEADVLEGERIYAYDIEKPTGWFNISLKLFNGSNEVKVRGYENVSSSVWLTGIFTTFTIYYDNQTPQINISTVQTSSNANSHNVTFRINDNFKINLSTLLVNITNSTYNVTHRYDSLVFNNTSWNWGNNITCLGNNTDKNCSISLYLPNGNYTLIYSVNDSVNNNFSITQTNYLVDSTRPSAPTIYSKSIQNITNLSVLWTDSSSNITNVQYAVGQARNPDSNWNSILDWTNATEDPMVKIIDSNNDDYPDSNESLVRSTDYNLSSDDIVNKTGYASLRNFLNGTEMFNCSGGSVVYTSNCTIVKDSDMDGIYNASADSIIGTNYSLVNLSVLKNFTINITYSDANHDNNYTAGEAIVADYGNLTQLDKGNLTNGIDYVLINGAADMSIPLTTINLSLTNHNFYYVSIQYKTNENLFYSLIGSSLSIKYKTSSGGGGESGNISCTGPSSVIVSAPLVSESITLTANWTSATDNCYNISSYVYSVGTEKYPASGYDSISNGWINNGLNTTNASITSNSLVDGQTYYWNVKAVNTIYQNGTVNSSIGTRYYDQLAPITSLLSVANDTNSSEGWLDYANDNITLINITGNKLMTCFISPYDKGYVNYIEGSADHMCVPSTPSFNASCNITNLTEGSYTYHVVCQDTSSPTTNKQESSNNLDISFVLNWPSSPEVTTPLFNQSNYTKTSNIRVNTTYTDQDNENGTIYFRWYRNLTNIFNDTYSNKVNGTVLTSVLSAGNFTKYDTINVTVYAVDSSSYAYNSSLRYNSTSINNTLPTHNTPIINSSGNLNRSDENLSCYVQSASDIDSDTLNYTYWWYRNSTLNLTYNYTNSTSNTISYKNLTKNDVWLCQVTPFDGQQNGTAKNSSSITISNTPPYNNGTVPNVQINKGTSNSDINLKAYFYDADSDSLIYNATSAENLTIGIVTATGIVTITPDQSFVGVRTVRFNATDSSSWSNYSNYITINVTNSTINVALISPINNYYSSSLNVTFNCSANNTINNNLSNVTLKVWNLSDSLYYNLTQSVTSGNSTNASITRNLTIDGNYTWNCYFEDNVSNTGNAASSRSFAVDTKYPIINFASGTESNNSNFSRTWVYAIVNVTESNEKNITFELYNSSGNVNNITFTTNQRSKNWTGLSDGTYTYNVTVCDLVDHCNSTETRTITLNSTLSPEITGISASVTSSTATIAWNTNINANSTVYYSTNISNLNSVANDSSFTTAHSVTVSGLSASILYYYNVSSCNTAGTCTTNGTFNFTTSAAGGTSSTSGGGGGSSSKTTATSVGGLGSSFTSVTLGKNDVLEFQLDGKTYTIKITNVGTNYIDATITTISQTFSMNVGDTKQIDVNGDAKSDVEIKLTNILDKKAYILIRKIIREPLKVITTMATANVPKQEVTIFEQPVSEIPSKVIESVKNNISKDIIPYAIAILMALAIVGSLVMKERMRVNYIYSQPELRLHNFIRNAKERGYSLDHIRKALISKGWPSHMVDSASLHEAISHLLSAGHNHDKIRFTLKQKGYSSKVVDDAIINHYIHTELKRRKSIKSIRQELIKAGWDKGLVYKKLPAAK